MLFLCRKYKAFRQGYTAYRDPCCVASLIGMSFLLNYDIPNLNLSVWKLWGLELYDCGDADFHTTSIPLFEVSFLADCCSLNGY